MFNFQLTLVGLTFGMRMGKESVPKAETTFKAPHRITMNFVQVEDKCKFDLLLLLHVEVMALQKLYSLSLVDLGSDIEQSNFISTTPYLVVNFLFFTRYIFFFFQVFTLTSNFQRLKYPISISNSQLRSRNLQIID